MATLTPKQLGMRIKKIRDSLGFSQDDISKHLGILRQSVSQIEKGNRSLDSIELAKLAELFSVSIDDLLKKEKTEIKEMKVASNAKKEKILLKEDKFKNTLLYVLGKCGGKPNLGETVLYKLLYFIDFDAYELLGSPVTGMKYVKLQYGPVPKLADYSPLIKEMIQNEDLALVKQKYHDKIQKRYIALKEANIDNFSSLELKVIDRVINTLSDMSAIQIEEYVHGDAPWKCAENNKEIGYNLVYYRSAPYAQRDYDEVLQEISGSDALKALGSLSDEEYKYYKNL